jgi:hypothetical protein
MTRAHHRIGWLVVGLAAGATRGEIVTIQVPLEDGRLQVRRVLEGMLRAACVEPGERLQGLDWTIDVASFIGRLQVGVLDRLVPGAVKTDVRSDAVIGPLGQSCSALALRGVVSPIIRARHQPNRYRIAPLRFFAQHVADATRSAAQGHGGPAERLRVLQEAAAAVGSAA